MPRKVPDYARVLRLLRGEVANGHALSRLAQNPGLPRVGAARRSPRETPSNQKISGLWRHYGITMARICCPDEEELARRLRDPRDHLAWIRLFQRIHDPLLQLGRHLGLTHEEADDAVQETLIHFQTDVEQGRFDPQQGRLTSWIWRLGKWKALEQMRRRPLDLRQRATVDDSQLADHWPAPACPWSEPGWEGRLAQAITRLADRVSGLEHAVFTALVVDRLDGAAVARRHGISRNSVYLHKRHALGKLRELLRGEARD
jgi:DNA-directed RNA polymerase specialized sigma24 family protein